MESDELDLIWEQEKIRRRKSYESLLEDVFVKDCDRVGEWNGAMIKKWSQKFREITGG